MTEWSAAAHILHPDHWAEYVCSLRRNQSKGRKPATIARTDKAIDSDDSGKQNIAKRAQPDRPTGWCDPSCSLHPCFIPVRTIYPSLSSFCLAPKRTPFKMDTKNPVDALGIHEISEKIRKLGEKVYESSEKPIVSISISW